jgi:hypothetical protein
LCLLEWICRDRFGLFAGCISYGSVPLDPAQVRTDADDIELEASLQEFAFNLSGDAVEADVALGNHGVRAVRHDGRRRHGFWRWTDRGERG